MVLASAVIALAGCSAPSASRSGSQQPAVVPSPSLSPSVSAPAILGPHGIVPFVDEPAGLAEFVDLPPPAATPPTPRGPGCRADQLRGALTTWHRTSVGQYGSVVVTNVSVAPCTLHGAVGAQLMTTGGPVRIAYSDEITDAAARIVTGMDPGATGSLRLDWDAPFCATVAGPLTLALTLPHGGGVLTVPVADRRVPTCVRGSAVTGGLRSGVFHPGDADHPVDPDPASPLQPLRVSVVSHPVRARAGATIEYVVALTNPTSVAIALDGPIGFGQQVRTGESQTAAQTELFRLNRRVITSIPAHATVQYAMALTLPASASPGATVDVNWLLYAPRLDEKPAPSNGFTLRIDG